MEKETPEARQQRWYSAIPLGRTGRAEDLAELYYFLTTPESAAITEAIVSLQRRLGLAGREIHHKGDTDYKRAESDSKITAEAQRPHVVISTEGRNALLCHVASGFSGALIHCPALWGQESNRCDYKTK